MPWSRMGIKRPAWIHGVDNDNEVSWGCCNRLETSSIAIFPSPHLPCVREPEPLWNKHINRYHDSYEQYLDRSDISLETSHFHAEASSAIHRSGCSRQGTSSTINHCTFVIQSSYVGASPSVPARLMRVLRISSLTWSESGASESTQVSSVLSRDSRHMGQVFSTTDLWEREHKQSSLMLWKYNPWLN